MPGVVIMFRWLTLAILLGAIGISAYYRWRARLHSEVIARRREGGWVLVIRFAAASLLIVPVISYIAYPHWMNWSTFAPPMWIRVIGLIIGIFTVAAVAWVLRSLGDNVSETVLTKTEHQLVITGPYRWVRHPLYTTGIALFLAIGLMQCSWLVLSVTAAVAVLVELLVIPAEERALVAKFGDEYRTYTSRTGRLLPRAGGFSDRT